MGVADARCAAAFCVLMLLVRRPYSLSKVLTERFTMDFVSKLGDAERFDAVFINPGAIYGPLLSPIHMQSSPQIVGDLISGASGVAS